MHNHTTQVPIHPRVEVHAHTHVCTQPDAVSLGPTQPLRTQHCGRARDSCPDSDLSLGACQSPRHNDAHMPSHTHSRLRTIKKQYPRQPFQTWIHNWNTFPHPSPHMSAHTAYKYPGKQAPTRHPCPLVSLSQCPPSPLHAPLGKKGPERRNGTAALCTPYS